MLWLLYFSPRLLLKNICVLPDRNALLCPFCTYIFWYRSIYQMNTHVHIWLMCAEHVYMFAEMSFLSYLTVDRMMDHFFALAEGHCKPFWCDASMGYSLCDYRPVSIWRKMFGVLCDMVMSCVLQFFSHVFLIHSIHVYKHISRALWWHIFWTKEELCYSYRLYQLSNLHEKWRWQFTGSQNCVIRFRTEIGQADDFNSLHDREREESTKSLLLPVTVCYINSCNISDLCSFNLIISACLCFGA